jgi:hypothetical protein
VAAARRVLQVTPLDKFMPGTEFKLMRVRMSCGHEQDVAQTKDNLTLFKVGWSVQCYKCRKPQAILPY